MNKAPVFSITTARNRTPKATTASRRALVASGCEFFAHLAVGFLEELGYAPELVTSGIEAAWRRNASTSSAPCRLRRTAIMAWRPIPRAPGSTVA